MIEELIRPGPLKSLWTHKNSLYSPARSNFPRDFVFYVDLWHPEQQGFASLVNGTGVATPAALVSGNNTVTVTTEGTLTITLPSGRTGTATSGTATVAGSPQSLVAGPNTVTVSGTGTITVNIADKLLDRSTNAAVLTAQNAPAWSSNGRTFGATKYIEIPDSNPLDLQNMTIAVVFKAVDTVGSHGIVGKWGSAQGDRSYAMSLNSVNNVLQFSLGDGTSSYNVGSVVGTTNKTVFIGTYDGATQKSYVNAVLDGNTARVITIPVTTVKPVIGKLRFEDDTWNFGASWIKAVVFWNRAFIQAEVNQFQRYADIL